MRTRNAMLALVATVLVSAARAEEPRSDMTVHEWGTFLAMSGSDGVSLDGMYHEEHALPWFVHARSKDQLRPVSIFLKGETPVIYFYTEKAQNTRVEVRFPRGLWTQWYPQAAGIGPHFSEMLTPASLRNGRIIWHASILPAPKKGPAPKLPETSSDALWNFAREVDSAYVQAHNAKTGTLETERFLFYRGLGTAPLPLRMTAASGGTLAMEAGSIAAKHVFVLRVEGGKAAYSYRPELKPGESIENVIPSMADARPVDRFADAIADDLAARLTQCGLYPKEARAMVNTWKTSYFRTDGVRALFVMPQEWTDEFIPMSITPQPKEIVRVMVGRIELLTPERERLAEDAVRDLGSPDATRREWAFATLRAQGRYVEPIVRRVMASTGDERVRLLCKRLLLTDFVTDLRTALQSVPNAKALPAEMRLNEDATDVRARLASLLREVGLDDKAKVEGEAVLKVMKTRAPQKPGTCEARHDLKTAAFAMDGAGDDRGAAERYGRLIDLAGLATRGQDCRKCHTQYGGPADADRLRDWWAGESYVRALGRAGGIRAEVTAQEAALAKPDRREEARLRLAYLYQVTEGRREEGEAMWMKLGATRRLVAEEESRKPR